MHRLSCSGFSRTDCSYAHDFQYPKLDDCHAGYKAICQANYVFSSKIDDKDIHKRLL